MLFCLAGLTVGLNINRQHWNARLANAKIRSPQMAYVNCINQRNEENEGALSQRLDDLSKKFDGYIESERVRHKKEMDMLIEKVTKLENELRETRAELRETKAELEKTKDELQKAQDELQKTRERLKVVENLLGISERDNERHRAEKFLAKCFERVAKPCASFWASS